MVKLIPLPSYIKLISEFQLSVPDTLITFRIPFSCCNYLTNHPIVRMMKLANEDQLFLSTYTYTIKCIKQQHIQ